MRVIAIWLDGFDMAIADRFALPNLKALASRSAVAQLDNGQDYLTGLSGEHLATGLDPRAAGRASAVWFDPATYACIQRGTTLAPIFGGVPTVVLDPCYFDLDRASAQVSGLTDWGAHDPGTAAASRPLTLRDEVTERFGPYPARRWIYATPWSSSADCARAGAELTRAVGVRADIATWLLGERLHEWDLALVGVSEGHSATEALHHGIDPSDLWRSCDSRAAAGDGLRSVYTAIDDFVGRLVAAFPDAHHVIFSPHGMGPNRSDVPTMVLLGELLRRWSGDDTPNLAFDIDDHGLPRLPDGTTWGPAIRTALGHHAQQTSWIRRGLRRARSGLLGSQPLTKPGEDAALNWMPLMRHQPHWRSMRAFAVPAFYDGRIRINLRGRESAGLVSLEEYGATLDELEELLRACSDPITGDPIVDSITRSPLDPYDIDPTDADMLVTWRPRVFGCRHPELGTIGPIPPRRSGGHTNPNGRCIIHGPEIVAGDLGVRSSFDVAPTILALAGSPTPHPPSGVAIDVTDFSSQG